MTTRDLSLGEIEALVTKAARGAGYPWGLASEAGAAARRLTAGGAPGADHFAVFLAAAAEGAIADECPIRAGLFIADGGRAEDAPSPWPEIRDAVAHPGREGDVTRCVAPEATLAALEALAARTYAPATEESRARGAG